MNEHHETVPERNKRWELGNFSLHTRDGAVSSRRHGCARPLSLVFISAPPVNFLVSMASHCCMLLACFIALLLYFSTIPCSSGRGDVQSEVFAGNQLHGMHFEVTEIVRVCCARDNITSVCCLESRRRVAWYPALPPAGDNWSGRYFTFIQLHVLATTGSK